MFIILIKMIVSEYLFPLVWNALVGLIWYKNRDQTKKSSYQAGWATWIFHGCMSGLGKEHQTHRLQSDQTFCGY